MPTYFQSNLTFICDILPLQISLTVLQNLTNYEQRNRQGENNNTFSPTGREAVS